LILKKTYLLLCLALMWVVAGAQVSPLADQFLLNPFLTNPAFTGIQSRGALNIAAHKQWLGIDGAPSWQSATWHSSTGAKNQHFNPRGFVNKGDNSFGNVGVGGGLFNVKYGAISQVGLHLDYAYHVYVAKGRLSFGLAPMYQQYIINKSGFLPPDGNTPDPLIDGDGKEVLHFIDVNAGVHYFSEKLFAGFSVVQLFNSAVSFGDLSFISSGEPFENPYLARSIYVYGGATPAFGKNLVMQPSVMVKYNAQTGFGIHANLRAVLYKNFETGLIYFHKESTGFFAGIHLGDLIFRYQFEAPLGTAIQTRFTTNTVLVGYML